MSNKQQLQANNEALATLVEALANNPTATEMQRAIETNAENIEKLSVDYIVERGNSNGWHYEKWNSGICKLYREVEYTPKNTGENYLTYNYPFPLATNFSPKILITTTRNHAICHSVVPTNSAGNYSDLYNVLDVLFLDVKDTNFACYAAVEVVAKWK